VGYDDNVDLYTYVADDPLDKTDPSGQWAGVDDLIASGVGAAAGVFTEAIDDAETGHFSGLQGYASAATGGAVGGWLALYGAVVGPVGIAGATAVGSMVSDGLKGSVLTRRWIRKIWSRTP
jgi:hypothetical protein